MSPLNSSSADHLGSQIAALVEGGRTAPAYDLLAPLLSARTPFRLLDRIGARIGAGPLSPTNAFLDRIAREKSIGGWPLIGSALAAQHPRDPEGALSRCRGFIIAANVWYAADTLAERVPGAGLVADFERALSYLARWRSDPDRWVRKSACVAIHLWTKRSRGEIRHLPKARKLLAFLSPMFSEQDIDAAKGVGWALKTMGRYYPAAVARWLERHVARRRKYPRKAGFPRGTGYRALMLRKALTYLPPKDRKRILKAAAR
jgi:hypothetical protein